MGKGDHEVTSSWTDRGDDQDDRELPTTLGITRSNITFIGLGKDTTTILGGFYIVNFENITFKNMTVTNTNGGGMGIYMENAKVELFDVALKGCRGCALLIQDTQSETTVVATRCEFANSDYGARVQGSLTSATFKNCVFHDNRQKGIEGTNRPTIHLHGEATAIHSNRRNGIYAVIFTNIIIHLPSNHNTSYNNGGQDRRALAGATITNVEDY